MEFQIQRIIAHVPTIQDRKTQMVMDLVMSVISREKWEYSKMILRDTVLALFLPLENGF